MTVSIHLGHVLFTIIARRRRILGTRGGLCRARNQEPIEERGDEALAISRENPDGEATPDAPTRELTAAPAPTRELPAVPAAGTGDRCSNCGSPLAHDQHYCVECGERRGQSTLPKAQPATEVRSTRVRSTREARPQRMSSGATMVAFVGVLLLAVGLGVLIGHAGKNPAPSKVSATPPVTILQQGGGGTSAAATTPTTSAATAAPRHVNSASLTKKAQAKLKAVTASKAVQQKAVQAAGKVLGNSNNLPPPTSTVGSSCSNSQAGCQGGKFTGNFFPGG